VSWHTELSMSDAELHVAISGDLDGDYVVEEQRPDGRLLIRPKRPTPAVLTRGSGWALSEQEFAVFLAEHRAHMLPADGEG